MIALLLSPAVLLPAQADAQPRTSAATPRPVARPDDWPVDRTLVVTGVGAVVGVLVFNVLAAPIATVPLAGGVLEAVPGSVALGSRLIAVVTTGAGALGATFVYDRWTGDRSDYGYMLSLWAGALMGVVAGNYLEMGMLGTPPYFAGASETNTIGAMASSTAQAASRIVVVGSSVLGAWAADYLYRH